MNLAPKLLPVQGPLLSSQLPHTVLQSKDCISMSAWLICVSSRGRARAVVDCDCTAVRSEGLSSFSILSPLVNYLKPATGLMVRLLLQFVGQTMFTNGPAIRTIRTIRTGLAVLLVDSLELIDDPTVPLLL